MSIRQEIAAANLHKLQERDQRRDAAPTLDSFPANIAGQASLYLCQQHLRYSPCQ